jgi:YVTN family beta-propeller protein
VINTATNAVSAPITVGKNPTGAAITPDGKHVYVTNFLDGTVSVITTATGAVSAPSPSASFRPWWRSPLTANAST